MGRVVEVFRASPAEWRRAAVGKPDAPEAMSASHRDVEDAVGETEIPGRAEGTERASAITRSTNGVTLCAVNSPACIPTT